MDLSRKRKRINELYRELEAPLEELFTRKPFTKGSCYELKTKCGKPACRCYRGYPHKATVLTWSEGGRSRMRVVKKAELARIKAFTENYRRFRKGRAKAGAIMKEILTLADEIEVEMLKIGKGEKK